jgi:hypothetical protein
VPGSVRQRVYLGIGAHTLVIAGESFIWLFGDLVICCAAPNKQINNSPNKQFPYIGNVRIKLLPLPGSLFTSTKPLCAVIMALT